MKKDESSPWLSLLKDSAVPSTEQADSSATELSQYDSRLRTEMEECDYGDDFESEYLFGTYRDRLSLKVNSIDQ